MKYYTIKEIGTGFTVAPKMALLPQEVKTLQNNGFVCIPF